MFLPLKGRLKRNLLINIWFQHFTFGFKINITPDQEKALATLKH